MTTRERDALGRFVRSFVNEECPDECNLDHGCEPTYNGQFTCPTTDTTYVRDAGEWVLVDRWTRYSTYVEAADEWYIDPADNGWHQCNGCGDFVTERRLRSDDWGDNYCGDCIDECGHFDRDDDDYDDDDEFYSGRTPSFTAPACDVCGHQVSEVTHYEPITDRVACASCMNVTENHSAFVPIPVFELVAA